MASTITYNKWDVSPIPSALPDNMIGVPQVLEVKQSWSYWTKGWVIPKIREDGKQWRSISDKMIVEMTKEKGLAFAIWRLHNRLSRLVDQRGRKIWALSPIPKHPKKIFIRNNKLGISMRYCIWGFTAKRIPTDMTGGMSVSK